MAKRPDINRLIEFQQMMFKFRDIQRVVYLPGKKDDHENDVEHSYFLTVSAWFLVSYFPKFDRDKVIRLALAHDIVEVHAGDTFAYGSQKDLSSKKARELAALEKLKTEWPDFGDLTSSIEEYENRASEEAKFVYALDKIMPAMVNFLDGGRVWQEHGITIEKLNLEKMGKIPVSPDILKYYKQLYKIFQQNPRLFPVEGKK